MEPKNRRDFVQMVGLGALGSMLVSQKALALAGGGARELVPGGRSTPVSAVSQPNDFQKFLNVGIGQDNIAKVRTIIREVISDRDLAAMSSDLQEARTNWQDGGQGIPAAAQRLENLFSVYEAELVQRVQDIARTTAAIHEPDQDPIDAWTLVHFSSGFLLCLFNLDFFTILKLLILWEIIEPHIWPGWNESPENQIVDVIAGMLGWALSRALF